MSSFKLCILYNLNIVFYLDCSRPCSIFHFFFFLLSPLHHILWQWIYKKKFIQKMKIYPTREEVSENDSLNMSHSLPAKKKFRKNIRIMVWGLWEDKNIRSFLVFSYQQARRYKEENWISQFSNSNDKRHIPIELNLTVKNWCWELLI